LLTPPPPPLPVTAGRRAAAAGKKHPARRRRLIKTGADYYHKQVHRPSDIADMHAGRVGAAHW